MIYRRYFVTGRRYFVTGLAFRDEVVPVFEQHLLHLATRLVQLAADRPRLFPSDDLYFHPAAIGVVPPIVLPVATVAV
ncbi:MAG: hypothetical protein ACREE2_00240 [Stellaceae bacterium]